MNFILPDEQQRIPISTLFEEFLWFYVSQLLRALPVDVKNAYMSSFYRNRLSILRALQIWILKSFKNFLKILNFFCSPSRY